jgi:hypothetical protein
LKSKEYKADDITKQFFDYDGAIILKDDPGQPLMVMESDDSCKYFDVNARILNSVSKTGGYENNDYQGMIMNNGSTINRRNNIAVNLDKYDTGEEPQKPCDCNF